MGQGIRSRDVDVTQAMQARPAAAAEPTLLCGRDRELGLLHEALVETGESGTRVVLLRGEAGSGKSSLLEAFLADARAEGAAVIAGRADPVERGIPYAPIHHALSRVEVEPSARPFVERALEVLGARGGDTDPEGRLGLVLEPGTHLLRRLAADGPIVLAVDDLHSSDTETLALLSVLLRRAGSLPVLAVLSLRTTLLTQEPLVDAFLSRIATDCRTSSIELPALDRVGTAEVLGSVLGAEPSAALVDGVLERSQGNPFFVTELATSLREGAVLSPDEEGRLQVAEGRGWPSRSTALVVRLMPLGGAAHRLARVLAVAGESVVSHLPALAAAVQLDQAQAASAFDGMVRAQLLLHRGEGTYGFRHELLREALLAELGPAEAARLHAALFRELGLLRDAGTWVDQTTLAHHALAATEGPDEAASAAAEAAGDAIGHFAPRSAAEWYARALAVAPAGGAQRAVLLAKQARSHLHAQQLPESIACGRAALTGLGPGPERLHCVSGLTEALVRCGDPAEEALDLLDEEIRTHGSHPRLLIDRSSVLTTLGRYQEAATTIAEARTLLAESGEPGIEHLRALASAAGIAETQGRLGDVEHFLDEQLRLAAKLPRRAQHFSFGLAAQLHAFHGRTGLAKAHLSDAAALDEADGGVATDERMELATTLVEFYEGAWDRALERTSQLTVTLTETGVTASLPMLEMVEVVIRASRGDIEGAREAARRSPPPVGLGFRALQNVNRGWLELADRRPTLAHAELAAALEGRPDEMTRLLATCLLARAEAMTGDTAGAAARLAAEDCAEVLERSPHLAVEWRLAQAEVLEDLDAALVAQETAERDGLVFLAAQAKLLQGQLGGDPERTLTEAWREFRALGADLWRRRAGAALRARKLPVPRAPRRPTNRLTDLELEIVRLVAEGLSNQEIALRLSYSKHTINAYLTRIYTLTGFASRVDLVRSFASGELGAMP